MTSDEGSERDLRITIYEGRETRKAERGTRKVVEPNLANAGESNLRFGARFGGVGRADGRKRKITRKRKIGGGGLEPAPTGRRIRRR